MIDWSSGQYMVPPLTKLVPAENLIGKLFLIQSVSKMISDTLALDRHIRNIREASQKVCGREKGDGYVQTFLKTCNKIHKFVSKNEVTLM